MRWAKPLLIARVGSIPEDHTRCESEPCSACEAQRWLTPEDWEVIRFYQIVRDQVNNLTPMGMDGNECWLAPRLEAWESAARLYGISNAAGLIEMARHLHECCERRVKAGGVHRVSPWSLMPETL